MARPPMYPSELHKRAVRVVAEIRGDYPTEAAALNAVMEKRGIGSRETLRQWFRQDQIDTGQRPGTTSEEAAQVKALKKEILERKRANEILKAASAFSRAELDRPHSRSQRSWTRCETASAVSSRDPIGLAELTLECSRVPAP